ncbi:MAG: phage portal protein [Pirellulales bacterium]|nr:phage portal protein [Pirellulales bacterium]
MTTHTHDTSTVACQQLEHRLLEAWLELGNQFVDPREPLFDGDGAWLPLGAGQHGAASPAWTEQSLQRLRDECRALAAHNEFAINGHENRISYIVGAGHTYRATVRKGRTAPADLPAAVQTLLDDFIFDNRWHARQQEAVRRRDRDGEALLRLFTASDGATRVRFVEPDQLATPPVYAHDPAASLGVLADRDDVETVRGYFIDGELVAPDDLQHRKANVDANVKRGLPLFAPVRKNLRRAEKLLRNMSVVAEIQSAIALIRRHRAATRASVERFVSDTADLTAAEPAASRTSNFRVFGPGTILDAPGGIEYDFPAAALDAGKYVTVLQAELRAIAARLVMPEFMLTSDASNANYASTMVAEGPATRMFQRLQAEQIADDLDLLWRVVRRAAAAGRLPADALDAIEIQAAAPSLAVRDPLAEAQVARIQSASGILSPQTWSQRSGLDYDQEQANLAAHHGQQSTGKNE